MAENDPHLVNILTSLGELHGRDNVARIAAALADPGPVKELADAAADLLRALERGHGPQPTIDRLRSVLYGAEVPGG